MKTFKLFQKTVFSADKRTAYLGVLQEHLNSKSIGAARDIEFVDGNLYRSCLVISFPSIGWKVRLLLAMKESADVDSIFHPRRLAMSRNCLRRQTDDSNEDVDVSTPSPFYNSTLLEDLYLVKVLNLQHQAISKYGKNLRNAILLLKRWLKVRCLSESSSFGLNCAFSVLACHVCMDQNLVNTVSSLQIFKLVLTWFIQRFNLSAQIPKVGGSSGSTRPQLGLSPKQFRHEKNTRQVYPGSEEKSNPSKEAAASGAIDVSAMTPLERAIAEATGKIPKGSGGNDFGAKSSGSGSSATTTATSCEALSLYVGELNVFFKCPPHVLLELDLEARVTLKNLDETFHNQFDQVFGIVKKPGLEWDVSVEYPLKKSANSYGAAWTAGQQGKGDVKEGKEGSKEFVLPDGYFKSLDFLDMPFAHQVAERICGLVVAGLEDRVLRVWVRTEARKVVVGLKLLPKNNEKAVMRGPSADDGPAVRTFKDLWGKQKPEVRRFKDGKIQLCLAWATPEISLFEKKVPSIMGQVIDHLLQVHFPGSRVKRVNTGPAGLSNGTLEEDQTDLWKKFQE